MRRICQLDGARGNGKLRTALEPGMWLYANSAFLFSAFTNLTSGLPRAQWGNP